MSIFAILSDLEVDDDTDIFLASLDPKNWNVEHPDLMPFDDREIPF